MKRTRNIICLLAVFAMSFIFASCSEDFQGDIDRLNDEHGKLEERISQLEKLTAEMNNKLAQLAVFGTAVEQGFYITEVNNTSEGYRLTFSNGRTIVLQEGGGNTLIPMPAVSMTQLSGFFYWTLGGQLLTDDSGQPIRVTSQQPIVKYDFVLHQWVISIDGGTTFKDINIYSGVVLNDVVLLEVINSYVSQHQTTLISKNMLYSIISTYIQRNYKQLFNVEVLNEVVANYITEHYTRLFSYELMETIFTQYDFSYYTDQIDVDVLVQAIVTFIQQHKEIFESNEVLYEIVSRYIEVNKTTLFKDELLLELVNNFFDTHADYLDVELLTQLVADYIDQHRNEVFSTETVKKLMLEYVEKYYTQIFHQQILVQAVNNYLATNQATIFNQTIIDEVLSVYLQNNFTTIINQQTVIDIVSNYLRENSTTVFNKDILIEIIANYFEKNYNLFIDRTRFSEIINTYIEQHNSIFIDVDIVSNIIYRYLEGYYKEVFTYDFISKFVVDYINKNQQVLFQHIFTGNDPIRSIVVKDDICTVTLADGQTIQLVVYDALARLKDRVQSIVVVPNDNGMVKSDIWHRNIYLQYIVSPASMADIIVEKFYDDKMTMELLLTDDSGNIIKMPVYEPYVKGGILCVSAWPKELYAAVALHIKETRNGGTDIMTDFTPIEYEGKQQAYLDCPDSKHPHLIDLGLPSGTKWACCNVGAKIPSDYGSHYAWGETKPKSYYYWDTYQYGSSWNDLKNIGSDIAGTQCDAAMMNWGSPWRMPTKKQFDELLSNCTSEWTHINGVYGLKFVGSNGGTVFLPAAGHCIEDKLNNEGRSGYYWSSTLSDDESVRANVFNFYGGNWVDCGPFDSGFRYYGNSVRPVQN